MLPALKALERSLRSRPLLISLILALVVSYVLSADGIVSEDAMPFGDGEHYALRGMTLYGFLHTGQWSQFWDVFTLPKQSLAPPHYWLFFLLPQSWASLTAYGAIQAVTTYTLLAVGIWQLCRALDRAPWAPAILLLCATQNISIDYSFFYFVDVPFMAMGTLALAWQVRAWRDVSWRNSIISGVGAGLLFWVKPPNAIIFAAIYGLAELIRFVLVCLSPDAKAEPLSVRLGKLGRHLVAVLAGFLPVATLALACGGFQSIIRLINDNEVSEMFATKLECTGLLRFFYFPLCLTFFYHAIALLVIFSAAGVFAFFLNRKKTDTPPEPLAFSPFPPTLLLPLVLAYFVLGEFFSFGEASKGMRSLLILLPVMWLAIFWGLERCRMRPGLMFLAAVMYVLCAYSQIFDDTFGTFDVPTESYQLKGDWLGRLPQPHYLGKTRFDMTQVLLELLHENLPEGGKVAVGSEQIYLTSESLSWLAQYQLALAGKRSPYYFENFLPPDGSYCRSALLHSRVILLFLDKSLQYTREVYKTSNDLVQFGAQTWLQDGTAQMIPLRSADGTIWGCFMILKEPLTDARINQMIAATKAVELSPEIEFNTPVDQRLSWQQCRDILMRWRQKRLGF